MTRSISVEGLRGLKVIGAGGRIFGEIEDLEVDVGSWHVENLVLRVRGSVVRDLGIPRPRWRRAHVSVPARHVRAGQDRRGFRRGAPRGETRRRTLGSQVRGGGLLELRPGRPASRSHGMACRDSASSPVRASELALHQHPALVVPAGDEPLATRFIPSRMGGRA